MVGGFTPGDQTDANSAFALLIAISDPARSQELLKDLVTKTETARVATQEAKAALEVAAAEREIVNENLAVLRRERADAEREAEERHKEFETRERKLDLAFANLSDCKALATSNHDARERDLNDRAKAVEDANQALDAREATISARDVISADRETVAANDAAAADHLRRIYEHKLEHVRQTLRELAEESTSAS